MDIEEIKGEIEELSEEDFFDLLDWMTDQIEEEGESEEEEEEEGESED